MSIANKKPVVLVIRPISSKGKIDRITLDRYLTPGNRKLLEEFADVKIADVTAANLQNVDVILSLNGLGAKGITAAKLRASKTLRHVVTAHHWYIHADRVKPACEEAGVGFTDASRAIDDAVAGAIVSAMFQARMGFYHHNLALRTDAVDAWSDSSRASGQAMGTAVVGLVSMGNIGKKVAQILRDADAFRPARVLAYSHSLTEQAAHQLAVEKVNLDSLLKESDIISLHSRITPETEGMMAAPEFELMKPDAVFINMARGALIDEDALIDKLERSPRFTAVLDVFSIEPLTDPGHRLYHLPNTFVTPHTAAYNLDLLEHTTRGGIMAIRELLFK